MLVGYVVKLLCIVALYAYMYLENKRRDRQAIDGQEVAAEGVENGMLVCIFPHHISTAANLLVGQNRNREQGVQIRSIECLILVPAGCFHIVPCLLK